MDTLTLKGLRIEASHGYYKEERESGNIFEVDLVFRGDFQSAAESDDLSQAVDYQKAEKIVRSVMGGEPVRLIETLARSIGNRLFNDFPNLEGLEVAVRKLNPPLLSPVEYAEIKMTWKR